jgi:hypothetical protein
LRSGRKETRREEKRGEENVAHGLYSFVSTRVQSPSFGLVDTVCTEEEKSLLCSSSRRAEISPGVDPTIKRFAKELDNTEQYEHCESSYCIVASGSGNTT